MDQPAGASDDALGAKSSERVVAFLLFLWLFSIICSYYILRPVRSALILSEFGPKALPWAYMGTALFTGIAVWIYTQFTYLPRKTLLTRVILFFISNFAVLWWIVSRRIPWSAGIFYVWTDIFSIMAVTVFWMYVNDVFPSKSAKRSFGIIGSAGPAGAIAGAALIKIFVRRVGVEQMLLVAGGFFGLGLLIFWALEFLTGGRSAERKKAIEKFEQYNFSEFSSLMRSVARSRVLTLLTVAVCFERFAPDFVDYVFSAALHHAYPDKLGYAAVFATFEFWRNVLVFIATLSLTSTILRTLGVHVAITAVPMTILIGGAAYALFPFLGVAIALKGLEEGQRHAWFKAGKEVIYTATHSDVIYKVKGYLEMFLYRFSRGLAGLIILFLTSGLGLGAVGVAWAVVPLAALWAVVTWKLGKAYETSEAGAADKEEPALPLGKEASISQGARD